MSYSLYCVDKKSPLCVECNVKTDDTGKRENSAIKSHQSHHVRSIQELLHESSQDQKRLSKEMVALEAQLDTAVDYYRGLNKKFED